VTTQGVTAVVAQGGEFIAGSYIGDTDGSQLPITILGDKYGQKMTDPNGVSADQPCWAFSLDGFIKTASIVNYPTDAGMKTWLKAQLNTTGQYTFDDTF
jgi:hypothetical protein